MPRLSSLRLAGLIGGLGTALAIAGFFLPCRFVTDTFPPNPPSYSADSFWSMLVNTCTGYLEHPFKNLAVSITLMFLFSPFSQGNTWNSL